jgi:hypothetical protein
MNTQRDSYKVLFKMSVLGYVLLSILNKISVVQQIWVKLSIRSLKFYENNFGIWIEDHVDRRADTNIFLCFRFVERVYKFST